MAKTRAHGTAGDDAGPEKDWVHFVSVGLVVGAVLGVLILAAVLETESSDRGPVETAYAATSPESGGTAGTAPPEPLDVASPTPAAAGSEELHDLARRAEKDLRRLTASGDGWTAQLTLLCDAEGATRMLEEFGSHRALYVLPTFHEGNACFLICWNHYPSADRARKARDLPASLRQVAPEPFPKPISQILK